MKGDGSLIDEYLRSCRQDKVRLFVLFKLLFVATYHWFHRRVWKPEHKRDFRNHFLLGRFRPQQPQRPQGRAGMLAKCIDKVVFVSGGPGIDFRSLRDAVSHAFERILAVGNVIEFTFTSEM